MKNPVLFLDQHSLCVAQLKFKNKHKRLMFEVFIFSYSFLFFIISSGISINNFQPLRLIMLLVSKWYQYLHDESVFSICTLSQVKHVLLLQLNEFMQQ